MDNASRNEPRKARTDHAAAAQNEALPHVQAEARLHKSPEDRRKSVVDMRNDPTGLERRRGPGRRRSDFAKSAEEGQMSPEQFLFIMAIDAYKRVNNKPFPTWTEVLEVIRKLGYRKTCDCQLQLPNCEDWKEAADAPAFVSKPSQGDDAEV